MMKIIKEIVKNMRDEIEDAEKYAWAAVRAKAEHPDLAEVYNRLSNAEIEHTGMLHKQAVEIIDKYRRDGHEPPVAMQAVWEWEHERYMEELAGVKRILEMYRN